MSVVNTVLLRGEWPAPISNCRRSLGQHSTLITGYGLPSVGDGVNRAILAVSARIGAHSKRRSSLTSPASSQAPDTTRPASRGCPAREKQDAGWFSSALLLSASRPTGTLGTRAAREDVVFRLCRLARRCLWRSMFRLWLCLLADARIIVTNQLLPFTP